ncbi:hypothetical protein [Catellatospora tritici]|uniref:hypothetical protein n=1 Tax=Catellatospora tritici TaxID=2851566 RepID=UPI001C2D144E|nr:hypothetical protein [Catellatospora tritici]MBV1850185.1 hypothetical protein [Catellatospora tritici]
METTRARVGDPLAHIDLSRLRADLRAVQRLGTSGGAFNACAVSAEIRQAYRTALAARDEAAAYLHGSRVWSRADLAEAICAYGEHEGRPRLVAQWCVTTAPQHLYDAGHELLRRQQLATALRDLLTEARGTAIRQLNEAELPLPDDPLARAHKAADVIVFARHHLDYVAANRNLYAANLVVHHGWSLDEVVEVAEADPGEVADAYAAAREHPPSDADARTVRELALIAAAIAGRIEHWESARAEAIADCLASGLATERIAISVPT